MYKFKFHNCLLIILLFLSLPLLSLGVPLNIDLPGPAPPGSAPTPPSTSTLNSAYRGVFPVDIPSNLSSFSSSPSSSSSLLSARDNFPAPSSGQIHCETTAGSPPAADANSLAFEFLSQQKTMLCVNAEAVCTEQLYYQHAASAVCGNGGVCVVAELAGWAVAKIVQTCQWNGLAGGYVSFDDFINVNLYYHWPA